MHDEIQALRQALEDGELEHDLALEVADRNLGDPRLRYRTIPQLGGQGRRAHSYARSRSVATPRG
jgi:hypothetical protein